MTEGEIARMRTMETLRELDTTTAYTHYYEIRNPWCEVYVRMGLICLSLVVDLSAV